MKCNYLGSSLRGLHSWIAKRLETLRLPAKMSSHVAWVILLMMGIFFFALVAVAAVTWLLLANRDAQGRDDNQGGFFYDNLIMDNDVLAANDAGHPDYVAAGDDYVGSSWSHTEIVDMNKF